MSALPPSARRYVAVVTAAGLFATAAAARQAWGSPIRSSALWMLVALAIAGEMVPLRVPFHGDRQIVTLSSTFVFALLLLGRVDMAILAQAFGSLASDFIRAKPWWKSLFNVAQYSISVGAASVVLALLGDHGLGRPTPVTPTGLLVMLVSGLTLYVVNNALIATAIAMSQGVRLRVLLRNDVLFQAAVMFVLLSQAPLLVLAIEQGMWLLPVFVPAVALAYRSGRAAVLRDHEALHDRLTDLPNRTAFHEHVRRHIEDGAQPLALLLVDLDRFREVNETLGHGMGDRLLTELGARLRTRLPSDFVARLGGDEFAIAASLDEPGAIRETVGRVQAVIATAVDLDGIDFRVRASIGVAAYPGHGTTPEELLQRAEVAMYVAKERRSPFELYSPAIDGHDPRRLSLIGELRRGIDAGQLVVHYQPVASLPTGQVVAAEALVRWQHPDHGLVPPDEFIPLAEATGDIAAVTLRVAQDAIAECARWRACGFDLRVAINVSPFFLESSLASRLFALLTQFDVPATRFAVEITESGAMRDITSARDVLGQLQRAGVHVSLDDFGTGHSSLSYLRRLPVDAVKVDRSFVLGMLTNDDDTAIVASTVQLAHSLGLTAVAEGVESEAVWRHLRDGGCDAAQGYYLSRPLPAARFLQWLSSGGFPVLAMGDHAARRQARA